MTRLAAPLWAAIALALCGVRGAEPDGADSASIPDHGSVGLPFPLASVVGDDYELQPFDLVAFEIFGEPDVTTQRRISATGDLRLPMLGSVNLRGQTVRDAEDKLASLYKTGGYFTNPQVILYVSQHSAHSISVIGQVNRPDRIEMPIGTQEMGLAQAVAMTGGLTRIAKASAIQVSRIGADGKEERFTVNLDAYLNASKGSPSFEFQLKPDDVVFVPERSI